MLSRQTALSCELRQVEGDIAMLERLLPKLERPGAISMTQKSLWLTRHKAREIRKEMGK